MTIELSRKLQIMITAESLLVMLTIIGGMYLIQPTPELSLSLKLFRVCSIMLFFALLTKGFITRDKVKRLTLGEIAGNSKSKNSMKLTFFCFIEFCFVMASFLLTNYLFDIGYTIPVGIFGVIVFYYVKRFYITKYEVKLALEQHN